MTGFSLSLPLSDTSVLPLSRSSRCLTALGGGHSKAAAPGWCGQYPAPRAAASHGVSPTAPSTSTIHLQVRQMRCWGLCPTPLSSRADTARRAARRGAATCRPGGGEAHPMSPWTRSEPNLDAGASLDIALRRSNCSRYRAAHRDVQHTRRHCGDGEQPHDQGDRFRRAHEVVGRAQHPKAHQDQAEDGALHMQAQGAPARLPASRSPIASGSPGSRS